MPLLFGLVRPESGKGGNWRDAGDLGGGKGTYRSLFTTKSVFVVSVAMGRDDLPKIS